MPEETTVRIDLTALNDSERLVITQAVHSREDVVHSRQVVRSPGGTIHPNAVQKAAPLVVFAVTFVTGVVKSGAVLLLVDQVRNLLKQQHLDEEYAVLYDAYGEPGVKVVNRWAPIAGSKLRISS